MPRSESAAPSEAQRPVSLRGCACPGDSGEATGFTGSVLTGFGMDPPGIEGGLGLFASEQVSVPFERSPESTGRQPHVFPETVVRVP